MGTEQVVKRAWDAGDMEIIDPAHPLCLNPLFLNGGRKLSASAQMEMESPFLALHTRAWSYPGLLEGHSTSVALPSPRSGQLFLC